MNGTVPVLGESHSMETFTVRLAKEEFIFAAAHFITYDGDTCEPIHGHNYGVEAELDGPLDENRYVVDFIAARKALRRLLDQLDHHVLLPLHHKLIRLDITDDEVTARFGDRRWVFPRAECALLPVVNTTAEEIAAWLGREWHRWLQEQGVAATRIRVGIDECHGQWGVWEWRAPVSDGPSQ